MRITFYAIGLRQSLFFVLLVSRLAFGQDLNNPNSLRTCSKDKNAQLHNCWGTAKYANGNQYVGEFKDNNFNGLGTYFFSNGDRYFGRFMHSNFHGQGVFVSATGRRIEGIWESGEIISEVKINLPEAKNDIATNVDRSDVRPEHTKSIGDHRKLEEEKRQREQPKYNRRMNLQASVTTPALDGEYTISIDTNTDTASLRINGDELGGRPDGRYKINRIARAGQDTKLDIIAKDVFGNVDSKTIIVSRQLVESKATYAALNPSRVKRQPDRDSVAIIIGVSDYRNLPKAAHADDDARAFYDYAIRALGVKPENIKLLVNQDADEIEIYKAFKTWLPSKVRKTTDVFVFYSGHGYTTADGKGLYWFPHRADRDLISKTAILVEELNNDILATNPRSVTVFADACYSGQARSGETLIASARPIAPKAETRLFPENFTVITASQHDQISSSSPDLQHGIFSYYLMKGMEGEADSNRDGKITLGEMQAYLAETVPRQAAGMSRKQEPQVLGNAGRVLVGK
jgi:hypothetical protein